jgi:hypothetical protein
METIHVDKDDSVNYTTNSSLRFLPLEKALPPISHSPRILPNAPFGGNPYPNYRNSPDFGSIGSISEIANSAESNHGAQESVQSLSLTVCKKCQDILLEVFEHCLNKHGESIPLLSTHHIDEEADGRIQSEVPYFDIVKDPTTNKHKPAFEDPGEKIERDRWVQQQNRNKQNRLDIGQKAKGLGIKTGKCFSGAIYKRMLDAKEREITQLRTQLYETTQREATETDNVKKLKRALNQSVTYYTFAEEWQQSESSRLQTDVRNLKGELSSLMAFLINSEVEKQAVGFER